jgi:preprotein translocase SecE subunit
VGDGQVLAVAAVTGVPIFNQLYLQAGVAGAILLLGAIITFYQVGVRKPTVEFLIATDAEMKKVNWSSRREIMGSTYVVIGACFLIAGAIWVFDFFFQYIFVAIKLLRPQG